MIRRFGWTLACAGAWLVFGWLTLAIPVSDNVPIWLQVASILLGLLLVFALLAAAERPPWPLSLRLGLFGGGVLWIAVAYLLNLRLPGLCNLGAPSLRGVLVLGLLAIALPVGWWLGTRMEKITNLVPLAVAMSMADIFSVYQGPTKHVATELARYHDVLANTIAEAERAGGAAAGRQAAATVHAPLVDYIVVHFPVAGTGGTVPVLGIGDFIVLAFLFRAAWVHGASPLLVFGAAFASTVAALAVSQLSGQSLPALPFIGLGTVGILMLADQRFRKLDRLEIISSIVIAVLFAALTAGKWALKYYNLGGS